MKDIDEMTPVEIGEYLQSSNHDHPIIMKHGNLYDIHYSVGNCFVRKYKMKSDLKLKEAIKLFASLGDSE